MSGEVHHTGVDLALTRASAAPEIFLSVTPARARVEASAAAARARNGKSLGSLDGATVSWKDMIDIAGTLTTRGSATDICGTRALHDAEAVRRCTEAGLVTVGKTNLSELAFSGIGVNPHYGTPANAGRVPGGSSSGAAASVARGIVRLAIGTDTAGSCRVPASFQGVVGFRPTRGRYPMSGVAPLAPSYDTVGTFAATVSDVKALDAVLAGKAVQPQCAPVPPIAVDLAVLDDPRTHRDVAAAFSRAILSLQRDGMVILHLRTTPLSEALAMIDTFGWPGSSEAALTHAALLRSPARSRLDRRVLTRLEVGASLNPKMIQRARDDAAELRQQLGSATPLLFAIPTVAIPAPQLATLMKDDEVFARMNLEVLRLAMAASLLDLPAISLPAARLSDGAHVGLTLVGLPTADATLLAAAYRAELALSKKAFFQC